MRLQENSYSCGPAAIRNAFRVFGHKVSLKNIAAACGTTEDGTDDVEMLQGIRAFNYTATEYKANSKTEGWLWLHGCLTHDRVVILCINDWQHWVVCIGSLGNRVVIFDSANYASNIKENGVKVWSKRHLMQAWWNANPNREGYPPLYAISISKKRKE
jgi:ABC-type bacteriocin/lantibiotic exporter with double-glycine peptidase domain